MMNESNLNDHPTLLKYAEMCVKSYFNPDPGSPYDRARFRYVDSFWLEGGVLGLVNDSNPNEAYVVFRGTSEMGNWFLTNGQAYEIAPILRDETATFGASQGSVHQGFLRAFALLWSGQDKVAFTTAKWQKFLFGPWITAEMMTPCLVWAFTRTNSHLCHMFWLWAELSSLVIFIQIIIGSGTFESLFHRENPLSKIIAGKTLELGPPLRGVIADLKQKDIIFIGHSLGGAMAALAFMQANQTLSKDKHFWLITFGAPRIGDDIFANWFHSRFKGRYNLIADRGDPVARIPPSPNLPKIALKHFSILGSILLLVYYLFWFPYKTLYGLRLGGPGWEQYINWHGEDVGLAFQKHGLKSYCETFDVSASRIRDYSPNGNIGKPRT